MTSKEALTVLNRKRGAIKAQLTRIKEFLNSDTDKDVLKYESKLDSLKGLQSKLSEIRNGYYEIVNEDTELQPLEAEILDLEEDCENIQVRIKHLFSNSLLKNESIVHNESSKNVNIKLPDIYLPKFCGSYHDWYNFKEQFLSLIDANQELSDSQKLYYLKSTLTGTAKDVVTIDDSYKSLYESLQQRFENKKLIVNSHFNELFSLEPIVHESAKNLRTIIDTCQKHLRGLKLIGLELNEFSEVMLINLVLKKLDKETRKNYELSLASAEIPKWEQFLDFLLKRCLFLENMQSNCSIKNVQSERNCKPKAFLVEKENKTNANGCCLCKKLHPLFKCHKFLQMNDLERYNVVKKYNLCINCLNSRHKIYFCQSKHFCTICGLKHHSLLHRANGRQQESEIKVNNVSPPPVSSSDDQNSTTPAVSQSLCSKEKRKVENEVLLSTCIILVENQYGEKIYARSLLDTGSNKHFCTREFCDKLGIKKKRTNVCISGINGITTNLKYCITSNISNEDGSFCRTLEFLVLPKITDDCVPSNPINTENLVLPPEINLADPTFGIPGKIDILIGNETYYDIIQDGKYRIAQLNFQKSIFGYIVSGSIQGAIKSQFCGFTQNVDNLELNIQKFWDIEHVQDETCTLSEEERFCEDHFLATYKRAPDGRFIVKMPIKENSQLGNSRQYAEKRLHVLWNNLNKNPEMEKLYVKFMEEYKSLNHMKRITVDKDDSDTYYLPHHGIFKPEKSSTKLRVVFNASAPSSNGTSLNDILLKGKVIEDVFDIMLRFRLHTYVFSADITKMYRQIRIDEDQRKYLRILWKKGRDEPVETYELQTVTYGTANAPFLAIRTLKQLAMDASKQFPLATPVILRDTFMDDILTGGDDLVTVKEMQLQLIQLLASAQMTLHKWNSNVAELLQIPNSDQTYCFSPSDEIKALGVLWKADIDSFSFRVTLNQGANITKRSVLSDIARIFDPLGLLGPVISKAKIFMQSLWLQKLDWTSPLPRHLAQIWTQFTTDLKAIESLRINRHVLISHASKYHLHGFADASNAAYGSVIYIQSFTDSQCSSRLLTSKSLVALLKTISIPRLELSACWLLSKLVNRVIKSLNLPITDVFLWTDSTIALAWIKTPPHQLKTFVANRVSKIQQTTASYNWQHVSSEHNPADIISRGLDPSDIVSNHLWWNGPEFLSQEIVMNESAELTNNLKTNSDFTKEIKDNSSLHLLTLKAFHVSETSAVDDVPSNFLNTLLNLTNCFSKLINIISYLYRFINNCRSSAQFRSGTPAIEEMNTSKIWLIKAIQAVAFQPELKNLKGNQRVSGNSKLKFLSPFLDSDGIIRVGGRLENAELDFNSKHPIVLPKDNKLSKMIFHHFHIKFLHVGPQALLHHVRQEFWILSGRSLARKVVHDCVRCFRYKPVIVDQIMGLLPAERVNPSPPFANSAVDFCGPFEIKYKNQRKGTYNKVFVALFVCLATKAVHIEMVTDLTSETFIASLKRFFARRGKSQCIMSDNGKTFVGASSELKQLYALISAQDNILASYLNSQRVRWKFIPPRSPNFGGLWEAGVKSLKYHLKRTVGNARVTYEEFLTILNQIEMILNSRPLFPLSSDANDLKVLTPAHFLIGRSLDSLPEVNLLDLNENRLSRWQRVNRMIQHIWKRWQINYLNYFHERHKWIFEKDNLTVGRLILLKEDNLPPGRWAMGRIVEIIPGSDKRVRVVKVKTVSGTYTRSISKICILPLNE